MLLRNRKETTPLSKTATLDYLLIMYPLVLGQDNLPMHPLKYLLPTIPPLTTQVLLCEPSVPVSRSDERVKSYER